MADARIRCIVQKGRRVKKRVAACAYAYANGDRPYPAILQIADAVQDFGAQAIFGGVMTALDVVEITTAMRVLNCYRERDQAMKKNIGDWADKNKGKHDLLVWARQMAIEYEMIDG